MIQGFILGPLLFIMYINDIVRATHLFSLVLYTDDTMVLTALNTDFKNNIEMLNQDLQLMSDLKVNKLC